MTPQEKLKLKDKRIEELSNKLNLTYMKNPLNVKDKKKVKIYKIVEDWYDNSISLEKFCKKYRIPLKKILKELEKQN